MSQFLFSKHESAPKTHFRPFYDSNLAVLHDFLTGFDLSERTQTLTSY